MNSSEEILKPESATTAPLGQRFKLALPKTLELNEEFKAAFNFIESTRECVFIAGKAGTGKSTLLQFFREKTRKNVVVLAPTGVAAVNVSGQTIHSFFRLPPKVIQKDHIRRLSRREVIERLDTVIIDEVSMVRADLLDGIDYALRVNRDKMRIPFGGAQVVFLGDVFQLPPVIEPETRRFLAERYASPYFFSAQIFQELRPHYIELKKIYRQSDGGFIDLLNRVRDRAVSLKDLEKLNERVSPSAASVERERITLTTTNEGANALNDRELNGLSGEEFQFSARVLGEFKESSFPTEERLRLKVGAQVMLIRNDPEKRWVNGTIGEVAELTPEEIKVRINGRVFDIPKVKWERIEYKYNEAFDRVEEDVAGVFEQYPLRLAWAITIHKAQGQQFDRVTIDLERGAFAHGQVYVALSRCTTLEGIVLKRPVVQQDIVFDPRVYDFRERFRKLGEPDGLFAALPTTPIKGQVVSLTHDPGIWRVEHVYPTAASDPARYRVSCDGKMKIIEAGDIKV